MMEIGEIIKERIALFKEIDIECSKVGVGGQFITQIYQEVCKDDRMAKIHAEKTKHGYTNPKSANTAWEDFDKEVMKNTELTSKGYDKLSEPATEKQVNLMIKLKIPSGKYTKVEAMQLIKEALDPKKRSE